MSEGYFSYVRVSTARQGQTGTSLAEQREAIRRYAARLDLSIIKEFEERETAAKRGRRVFAQMLSELKAHKAAGVVMHKIDRSARNLKDWADLGEMIDRGARVHFVNESIDLRSRGGRLSADIQAVVAADYVRNLREETKKGFYGRIKQGLYPMPARVGYLDRGKGLPKVIDPVHGPLVKEAFLLYATGKWSLLPLADRLYELGLRNKRGGRVSLNGLSTILHNPFYTGMIRISKTGELYAGRHEPLVPKQLFDQAQAILSGKNVERKHRHSFLFRKHIVCARCGKTLIGETHKGHNYYRCQARGCPQKTVREEIVESALLDVLRQLRFSEAESDYFRQGLAKSRNQVEALRAAGLKANQLQLEQVRQRLSKLTDAYLDGVLDEHTYVDKKNSLLLEEQAVREKLKKNEHVGAAVARRVGEFLELANNAYLSYESAIPEERRELVKIITSNFEAEGKKVLVKPRYPFELVAARAKLSCGSPHRGVPRTLSALLSQLVEYFQENEIIEEKGDNPVLRKAA
jgi:DNA invertase Pin-like site-specific DNA recombinase